MTELGRGPTSRGNRWPPQCCVPAFLGSAVAAFYDCPDIIDNEEVRRKIAKITRVVLSPSDENPWSLPTSATYAEWGVTRQKARSSFTSIQKFLTGRSDLTLDFVELNKVVYGMYEDAIADFVREQAIVGIDFDFFYLAQFCQVDWTESVAKADHVVRLTPLGDEVEEAPNILSAEFRLDYSSRLHVFDDSSEIGKSESLVDWQALVRASRIIDGSFWIIRRPGQAG
ncbi:MAG TPA: hypothetical protein VMV07_21315 [Streptosporangiaceae bacterium]|nr:hypothetical protein [Streptosporangiaceae bacterium]